MAFGFLPAGVLRAAQAARTGPRVLAPQADAYNMRTALAAAADARGRAAPAPAAPAAPQGLVGSFRNPKRAMGGLMDRMVNNAYGGTMSAEEMADPATQSRLRSQLLMSIAGSFAGGGAGGVGGSLGERLAKGRAAEMERKDQEAKRGLTRAQTLGQNAATAQTAANTAHTGIQTRELERSGDRIQSYLDTLSEQDRAFAQADPNGYAAEMRLRTRPERVDLGGGRYGYAAGAGGPLFNQQDFGPARTFGWEADGRATPGGPNDPAYQGEVAGARTRAEVANDPRIPAQVDQIRAGTSHTQAQTGLVGAQTASQRLENSRPPAPNMPSMDEMTAQAFQAVSSGTATAEQRRLKDAYYARQQSQQGAFGGMMGSGASSAYGYTGSPNAPQPAPTGTGGVGSKANPARPTTADQARQLPIGSWFIDGQGQVAQRR